MFIEKVVDNALTFNESGMVSIPTTLLWGYTMKIKFVALSCLLLTAGCSTGAGLNITDNKLPYWQKLDQRSTADLDMVVIHSTELPDMPEARFYGERALYDDGTGASGHYYIDRDGSMEQYVPDDRIAHHTVGWNNKTLSIELVNAGRFPDHYQSDQQKTIHFYPQKQIDTLVELLTEFKRRYPTIKYVQGHEDLDRRKVPASDDPTIFVERKMDPGHTFPWVEVLGQVDLIKQIPPFVFRGPDRPEYNNNVTVAELDAMLNNDDVTMIDVRLKEDFALDPMLIPGAEYKNPENITQWSHLIPQGKKVVLYGVKGAWVSHKAANYLTKQGFDVSTLEGGIRDWKLANEK